MIWPAVLIASVPMVKPLPALGAPLYGDTKPVPTSAPDTMPEPAAMVRNQNALRPLVAAVVLRRLGRNWKWRARSAAA